jgi:hypothetical protein
MKYYLIFGRHSNDPSSFTPNKLNKKAKKPVKMKNLWLLAT